jgi:integrase
MTRKSNIKRTLAQATGGVMLSTAADDLGIVPARSAAAEAARVAQQTGEAVTLRDPTTDKVIGTAEPGGGVSPAAPERSATRSPPNKRVLTELYVRKVKPRATAFVVWDLKQRGLVLRIQPSSRRSFSVIYNRHGRTRWLHLGDADAIGLADARQLAAEAMLEVARGHDPASERKAQRSSGTFAELAERYVEQHSRKHNKSWRQGASLISRFALPKWGKLQASAISRSDVRALIAGIEAPIVANQSLAAISAVFTWGTNNDLIAVNPCHGIKAPNPTQRRERALSASELPGVWAALGDLGVAGRCLKTILLTGQRPGECARMRYEHLRDGFWEMPGSPVPSLGWKGTKNSASHRVPISQAARALVGEGATGFVFAGPRGRPVYALDAIMREVCKKLGLEDLRPHDLRRSCGTMITKLKFGRFAMNRILNHRRKGDIADTYDVNDYEDENRHIVEAVTARIMSLAEGKGEAGNNVVNLR